MAPSGGGSPYQTPPSLRQRHSFPPLTALRRLGGVILTVICVILIIILSPVVVGIRFIGFLKRKSRRWTYRIKICSHQWPLSGTGTDIGLIALVSDLDDVLVNSNINTVSLGKDEFAGERLYGLGAENIAKNWNQGERRVINSKDLVSVLNEPAVFPVDRLDVRVINDYSDEGRASCLILVSNPPKNCVCVPRLFSVLSNQRLYLEMEPLPAYHFFVPIRHAYCLHNFIIVSIRLLSSGPWYLLSLMCQRPSPLWRHLTGESRRKRKRRNVRTRDSSTDTAPEEVVVHSKENGSLRDSSLLSQEPSSTHYRCWRAIPNSDLIGRAERLLRATSAEMMLALVAGALRGYCRDQGLPHPPDLGVLVPVSCRNFLPVACQSQCDIMTFPMMLPTGVEGTIPRVWTVQRRLYEGLNGHKPAALKIAQLLARTFSTEESAVSWMKPLFSSHSIHVAFYRASGDFRVSEIPIDSLMFFPSFEEGIKASFVFIQCGRNTNLCASFCRRTFPDPSLVLDHFEKEANHLLDHLSVRLLSLPQSTFLPGVFAEEEQPETMTSPSEYLREKTTPKRTEHSECSIEELHELLATVQSELDGMRANPQGNRAEYIQKLSDLEHRMQQFHDIITEKLGVEVTAEPEDGDAVETILAPYRQQGGSQERRYSRDSHHRIDEQRMRKASRTSI